MIEPGDILIVTDGYDEEYEAIFLTVGEISERYNVHFDDPTMIHRVHHKILIMKKTEFLLTDGIRITGRLDTCNIFIPDDLDCVRTANLFEIQMAVNYLAEVPPEDWQAPFLRLALACDCEITPEQTMLLL